MPETLDPFDPGLPGIMELIQQANADNDPVSVSIIGETLDDAVGAIVVVRGNKETRDLCGILKFLGLLHMPELDETAEVSAPPIVETLGDGTKLQLHPALGLRVQRGGA